MEELTAQGMYCSRNKDRYGPDIIVYSGLSPSYYIEAEIKLVWKADSDMFPWETIQIPERKGKFMRMRKALEFWVFRQDLQRCIVIPGKVAKASPQVEVSNKYVSKGEMFYQVPVVKCKMHILGKEYVSVREEK